MTPSRFHIRPATAADADAIIQVHAESVRILCAADYPPWQIDAWMTQVKNVVGNWLETKLSLPGLMMLVAESNFSVVGFGERWLKEIYAVYVHPLYTRRGIGSALVAELERSARDDGLAILELDASLTAEPFYRACGYEIVSRGSHSFIDGTAIASVRMAKRLQSPARAGK